MFKGELRKKLLALLVIIPVLVVFAFVIYFANQDKNVAVSDVMVTNLTDTGFTVIWRSAIANDGELIFREGEQWPILFGQQFSTVVADDRVTELNSNGSYVRSAKPLANRYTHHVTVRNLKPDSIYSFRIGGRVDGKVVANSTLRTKPQLRPTDTPDPAYGKVTGAEFEDTIVVFKSPLEGDVKELLSTTTNNQHNFSIDMTSLSWAQKDASRLNGVVYSGLYTTAAFKYGSKTYKPLDDIVLTAVNSDLQPPPLAKTENVPVDSIHNSLLIPAAAQDSAFCSSTCSPNGGAGWDFGTRPNLSTPNRNRAKWCQCCNRNCGGLSSACTAQLGGEAEFDRICSSATNITIPTNPAPSPITPVATTPGGAEKWCVVCQSNVSVGINNAVTIGGQELATWSEAAPNRTSVNWGNSICNGLIPSRTLYTRATNVRNRDCAEAERLMQIVDGRATSGTLDPTKLQCVKNNEFIGRCPSGSAAGGELASGVRAISYSHCDATQGKSNCFIPAEGNSQPRETVICYKADGGLTRFISKGPAGLSQEYNEGLEICYSGAQAAETVPPVRLEQQQIADASSLQLESWDAGRVTNSVVELGLTVTSCAANPVLCGADLAISSIIDSYTNYSEDLDWERLRGLPNNTPEILQQDLKYKYEFATGNGELYCGVVEQDRLISGYLNDRGLISMVNTCSIIGTNPRSGDLCSADRARGEVQRAYSVAYREELAKGTLQEAIERVGRNTISAEVLKDVVTTVVNSGSFSNAMSTFRQGVSLNPLDVVMVVAGSYYQTRDQAINPTYSLIASGTSVSDACCSGSPTNLFVGEVNNIQGRCPATSPLSPRRASNDKSNGGIASSGLEQPKVLGAQSFDRSVTESGTYVFTNGNQILGVKDVVVTSGKVDIKVYNDLNANDRRDEGEDYITDLPGFQVEQQNSITDYSLSPGWNLINLNLLGIESGRTLRASNLINLWNNQGAAITQVVKYETGQFVSYTNRGKDDIFGPDFNLLTGQGYFVLNARNKPISVTFRGLKPKQFVPINLTNGWNLVGFTQPSKPYTAQSLINTTTAQGGNIDTVSRFENGSYSSYIYGEDGTFFGNDFNINERRGYFLKVNSSPPKALDL